MKNLNLDEMLRYVLAGGMLVLCLLVNHEVPHHLVKLAKQSGGGIITFSFLAAFSFLIGSLLYALHRAAPYWFFYMLLTAFTHDGVPTRNLDFERWRRERMPATLQSKFKEWASQIHFLYCLTWAVFLSQIIGEALGWKSRINTAFCENLIYWLGSGILCFSLFHHLRYLLWERDLWRTSHLLIKIPPALRERVEGLARERGVSLEQFVLENLQQLPGSSA